MAKRTFEQFSFVVCTFNVLFKINKKDGKTFLSIVVGEPIDNPGKLKNYGGCVELSDVPHRAPGATIKARTQHAQKVLDAMSADGASEAELLNAEVSLNAGLRELTNETGWGEEHLLFTEKLAHERVFANGTKGQTYLLRLMGDNVPAARTRIEADEMRAPEEISIAAALGGKGNGKKIIPQHQVAMIHGIDRMISLLREGEECATNASEAENFRNARTEIEVAVGFELMHMDSHCSSSARNLSDEQRVTKLGRLYARGAHDLADLAAIIQEEANQRLR